MRDRVHIQAGEKTIGKIFSDDYAFIIPYYQRPYSWRTEHAGQLLDDLLVAAFEAEEKPYFLGSIVLVKEEGDPTSEVIDGQQRLVTLTILLSVLRDLLPNENKSLTSLIYEEADYIRGTEARFRVALRSRDQEFFERHIQHEGQISQLPKDAVLPEGQTNILRNALHFKSRLEGELGDVEKYTRLARYIAQYCYLVVVETSDQESAYRIFSVLNDRGLPLILPDILKAEVLGAIPDARHQEAYTKKWEEMEGSLGREPFEQLFSHIRMIFVKAKARQSVLSEIRERVKPSHQPMEFIDETLEPYADSYFVVKNADFKGKKNEREINWLLRWLNQTEDRDWMPAAMVAVKKWATTDSDKLFLFLRRLERLAFATYALRFNVNGRIERYARVLSALETDIDPGSKDSGLGLRSSEKSSLVDVLSGDIYDEKCVRYVLLRLNERFDEGEVSVNYPVVTIEHVLPQTPPPGSGWVASFTEDDRKELTSCLGNLVLLSRRKNSAAQNFDFDLKKKTYFGGKTTSFALTKKVVDHQDWSPAAVRNRQRELIQVCKEIWRLEG